MKRGIVCFGEALIDFLAGPVIEGQPRAFLQQAGGAPANVAVAVAQLGGSAQFVGMLSNDLFGDFLLASLVEKGVDTSQLRRTSQAPTALAFVALDAHGERSFSFRRPPAADLLFRDKDYAATLFEQAAIFHVCSNSLTEAAIAQATLAGVQRARDAGVLVSFDLNLRPALWAAGVDRRARLWAILALADVVKLSAEEFDFLAERDGYAAVLDNLWRGATRLLVVSDAAAPIRWYTPHDSGDVDGFRVCVVDTTGAGDAFVGGLLFKLAERGIGRDQLIAFSADQARRDSVLRFATACGALSVTRHGGFTGMPDAVDVDALLKSGATSLPTG